MRRAGPPRGPVFGGGGGGGVGGGGPAEACTRRERGLAVCARVILARRRGWSRPSKGGGKRRSSTRHERVGKPPSDYLEEDDLMNTRKALPITTVLLILALALATVGVGYGLWSKVLTISGIVETGKLDVTLSLDEVDEGALVLPANGLNPGFWEEDNDCDEDSADSDDCEVEGKEIAECTAVLLDEEGLVIGSIPPGGKIGR